MAAILKSNQESARATGFSGVAGFNLDDLAVRAQGEMSQLHAEATKIVERAKAEADSIRQQAVKDGKAEGLKQADEVVDQRVKVAVDAAVRSRLGSLEKAVDEMWERESEWLQQWQENTIKTAMDIARKITRSEIESNPEIIASWAAEAIDAMKGARVIVVAVHPETLSILGPQLDAIVRRPGLPESTRVEPDESVDPMGVVVRQDGGAIDMQLEGQLDELFSRLTQAK